MTMSNIQAKKKAPHTSAGFKGYTLSQLRYQRALVALRREYCKDDILASMEKARKLSPFSKEGKSGLGGVAGKIVGGLNFLDMAMIGFSAFNAIRKIRGVFKHR